MRRPSCCPRRSPPFAGLIRRLHRHDWVVYAKPAFGGPLQVLRYLGRYTHRVAISNHRFRGSRLALCRQLLAGGSSMPQAVSSGKVHSESNSLGIVPAAAPGRLSPEYGVFTSITGIFSEPGISDVSPNTKLRAMASICSACCPPTGGSMIERRGA
jgi:hypothetical protein